jgi:hypothetical protein
MYEDELPCTDCTAVNMATTIRVITDNAINPLFMAVLLLL